MDYLDDQQCIKDYQRLKEEYFNKYPEGRIRNQTYRHKNEADNLEDRRSGWIFLEIDGEFVFDEEITTASWKMMAWINKGLCWEPKCKTPIDLGWHSCDPCAIERLKEWITRHDSNHPLGELK